ncbi:MAG TPA: endonuclease/exonuclease/phosphatase family protein [Candidatus Binatia bacterium]|jgi:endonuclease/exonuclease/phosphatase family metal-dependent hydrolase|nr:endonuclease/exonuclease/phosphatase family protein [Candidatus Binatia bacterium]
MILRIATLNLEQDHKRWETRRELIAAQLRELHPDLLALNEIHVTSETGRWLQREANLSGIKYALLQQSKVGADSRTQAEGLLTRYPIIETANLDYRSHNCVALAARFEIEGRLLDVYVTHLIAAKVEDTAREEQVTELLKWIRKRDADFSVACGDFNATLEQPSIRLMSGAFRPTQSQPTAFTPLREPGGSPTHPEWERFDRCIDYIWVSQSIKIESSGLCLNRPAEDNPDLWPSDHVGVWADLELG